MVRPARVRALLLLLLGVALGGMVTYLCWPTPETPPEPPALVAETPPENPQASFQTPYRNVRPDVAYVGDEACAVCHADIDKTYHHHPMGRSAFLSNDPKNQDRYDASTHPTFKTPVGRAYQIDVHNNVVQHSETFTSLDGKTSLRTNATVDVVVGSGQLGKSYLCSRDGSVWQSGISWFSSKNAWDISPGFGPGRHNTRGVVEGCLYCHVNRVEAIPGTMNRYKEPLLGSQAHIGCERCHGPGQLHVQERHAAKDTAIPDMSIVNPKHLEPHLRDAVCQQCHLQGAERVIRRGRSLFEYRPGLPLELFQAIYVRPADPTGIQRSVGQVEQMRMSRCATASNGKLGCASCHNPHLLPNAQNKDQHFRQACLNCHQEKGCSAPLAQRQTKNDLCVHCHMVAGESRNIPHASVTDHRILRTPKSAKANPILSDGLPLTLFHEGSKHGPSAEERERDLGIALAHYYLEKARSQVPLYQEAKQRLEVATKQHPSDIDAWEMLARLYASRGLWKEAQAIMDKALALAPNHEALLQQAVNIALMLDQPEKGLAHAKAAAALNPGNHESQALLGRLLIEVGEWAEAERVYLRLLQTIPTWASAHVGLAICMHRKGEIQAARQKLELAAELEPETGAQHRQWFRTKTK